jgi:Fic family protein
LNEQRLHVINGVLNPHRNLLGHHFWHANEIFNIDERALRLHNRLIRVHPFPNGNGRCTRLMADLYLVSVGAVMFSWGSESLDVDGETRERYIGALLKARHGDDYGELIAFARS